jgi:hypothetical protein
MQEDPALSKFSADQLDGAGDDRACCWPTLQALPGIPASLQMARRLLPSASRAQIDMAT